VGQPPGILGYGLAPSRTIDGVVFGLLGLHRRAQQSEWGGAHRHSMSGGRRRRETRLERNRRNARAAQVRGWDELSEGRAPG